MYMKVTLDPNNNNNRLGLFHACLKCPNNFHPFFHSILTLFYAESSRLWVGKHSLSLVTFYSRVVSITLW